MEEQDNDECPVCGHPPLWRIGRVVSALLHSTNGFKGVDSITAGHMVVKELDRGQR